MKLAVWNCNGKFETNLPHLLELGVDVAVVCEARAPSVWQTTPDGRAVAGLSQPVPRGGWRELVVLACDPWVVELHEAAASAPAWTLPVRVSGPRSFTLVGLHTPKLPGNGGYEGEIDRAIDWMDTVCDDGPMVLAGDFNSPISDTQRRYDQIALRLERMSLRDVYRSARGLERGEVPPEATHYQRRLGEVRGFHLDHLWLPTEWTDGAKVDVGDFDTWVKSGRSDHVPVIAGTSETY